MERIRPYTEWEHQNTKKYLAIVVLAPAADAGGCGGTGKVGASSHGRCSHSQHLHWGRGSVTKQVSRVWRYWGATEWDNWCDWDPNCLMDDKPSCPYELSPQHLTADAVDPQVWAKPAKMLVNVLPPKTAVGISVIVFNVPFDPIWP
jgi:hypothetical protein